MAVVGPLLVHPVREVQEVEVSRSVVMNALTWPFSAGEEKPVEEEEKELSL